MKILVVNDDSSLVKVGVEHLRMAGLDADGIIVRVGRRATHNGIPLTEMESLALVRSADVIFLDHNMPGMKGDQMLQSWKKKGVNLVSKRVIGTSTDPQPYVTEHYQGRLWEANRVKIFLGL